jgi:hypothetical protein
MEDCCNRSLGNVETMEKKNNNKAYHEPSSQLKGHKGKRTWALVYDGSAVILGHNTRRRHIRAFLINCVQQDRQSGGIRSKPSQLRD